MLITCLHSLLADVHSGQALLPLTLFLGLHVRHFVTGTCQTAARFRCEEHDTLCLFILPLQFYLYGRAAPTATCTASIC